MHTKIHNLKEKKLLSNKLLSWQKCLLSIMLITNLLSLSSFVFADVTGKRDKAEGLFNNASINPTLQLPGEVLVTRHSPNLSGTRVEGSIRVLLGESFSLNSNTVVTGDIYVPGTPNITINGGGNSVYRGTVVGTGNNLPSGYSVALNSNTTLNHIVTRTDAIQLNPLPNVAQPQGTRDLALSVKQTPGDFSTIRNLTLNSNYGLLAVPAGTYGQFTANAGSGFILGVDNQSTIYNFQSINLNSNSEIQIKGNVTINVQNTINFSSNVKVGNPLIPVSLSLNISNGGLNLNSNTELYGAVKAPNGQVNLNSNSKLVGLLACDRVNLNSNSLIKGFVSDVTSPQVTITSPTQGQNIDTATTTVTGSFSDDSVVTSVKVNNVNATINNNNYSVTIPLNSGSNTISVVATDIFGNAGNASVTVTRGGNTNQPPVVSAGADQTVTLPTNSVSLNGTATDDGLPNPPGQLTLSWSKVSGSGSVSFSSPNSAITQATFSQAGAYLLRLSVSDSLLSSTDDVIVTVNPAQANNQSPQVNAGQDQVVTLPNQATLQGQVTDDGLPNPPSQLTLAWSKVSGSGTVNFTSPNTAITQASFSLAGTYVLRLMASDSVLVVSDDVIVTVNPAQAQNLAPQVNAGADRDILLPAAVYLEGTASDDGLPTGSVLSLSWSKISGPSSVIFTSQTSLATYAVFDSPGTYVLRLTATDGQLTSTDDLVITLRTRKQIPLYSNGYGFDPDELTVKRGEKTIIVHNRTGFEITYIFVQGSQNLSILAKPGEDIFIDATLEVGTATISASGHPEWTCTITVVP